MKKWLVFICFIASCSFVFSQRVDAGAWASVSLSKKFYKKKLELGGSVNLRMNNGMSQVDSYFPEVYLSYTFFKILSLSADYRISLKNSGYGWFTPKHRVGFDFKIQKKISPLKASARLRYQYAWDARGRTHFFQPLPSHALRMKIKIAYDDWDVVSPFIGNEVFYDLGTHDEGKRFNGYRLSAGAKFDLPKRQSIKLTYIFNLEMSVPNPWREHVVSVGYAYSFKSKKSKKKKKEAKK